MSSFDESALDSFGRDLTRLALEDKLDWPVERASEIESLFAVLTRRTGNSALLVGGTGVGKTAIVHLAALLISGRMDYRDLYGIGVPDALRHLRIVMLDRTRLATGAPDLDSLVRRLEAALGKARTSRNVILFLDHLLDWIVPEREGMAAATLLKAALNDGDVRCIAECTPGEYQQILGGDPAWARLFQMIDVKPPGRPGALEMLRCHRDRLECHHRVQIGDEAMKAAIEMSDYLSTGRELPAKAIDIIEEASVRVRVHLKPRTPPPDLKLMEEQIERLIQDKEEAVANHEFERAAALRDQADKLLKKKSAIAREWAEQSRAVDGIVDENVIAEVVRRMTGIQISPRGTYAGEDVDRLEPTLSNCVVGQPVAVRRVCEALRRYRAGLKPADRPIGSLLFAGPSGTGKTLLAERLAELAFGGPNALIRVHMGPYSDGAGAERFTASRGPLVGGIRQRPHSLVLLEGAEKAHQRALSLLLPAMETGSLVDEGGRPVDFRQALLIITTTVGADVFSRNIFGFAREPEDEEVRYRRDMERLEGPLQRDFSPDFLGRLDDVIRFRLLERDEAERMLRMRCEALSARLREPHGVSLKVGDEAIQAVLSQGYDPSSGAWSLIRAFEHLIEAPIAEVITGGGLRPGMTFGIQCEDRAEGSPRIVVAPMSRS